MKPKKLLTTGAVALGLLATAAAPSASAAADQSGDGQLRVTIGQPRARANALASPAATASCTVNCITINRFSECEWVTVHLDVVKVINGRPVIEGTADFSVKHQMTLKTNSANWSEKFTISKAATTGQGNGVAVKFSATSGGTKATAHFQQGHTLDSAAGGSVAFAGRGRTRRGIVNGEGQTRRASP
ncbi:hypothetical protein [Streptomyces olivochromogenes]|uniref:hypothetical protein n=1 Tax=Streptomyces olivochromogenes TaxID=1963 RepID=UPI0036974946